MSVNKDASRRWIEMEREVAGSPEEVWQAIATGKGVSAWFLSASVEERKGGEITFSLGPDMRFTGHITEWEPPHRLGYEEPDWLPGAPPMATEITVVALSGSTCKVRMVHSLFTSKDDWNDELETIEDDLQVSLETLRLYLEHFSGQSVAKARASVPFTGKREEAWDTFRQALGLGSIESGDTVDTSTDGAPRLSGLLEYISQRPQKLEVLVRMQAPYPGVATFGAYGSNGQVSLVAAFRIFDAESDQAAANLGEEWKAWMDARFGAA